MELLILLATNSSSTILLRRSENWEILNFYSASRQGGGQSRRPSKGQIPVCAASGANTLQGGVVGGSNCRGNILQPSPPDRTCQCTVHMVEGRSYRARGISKHISTICNARDRDPRAPNTLAFCFVLLRAANGAGNLHLA